jgi:hypothetical protein
MQITRSGDFLFLKGLRKKHEPNFIFIQQEGQEAKIR